MAFFVPGDLFVSSCFPVILIVRVNT